MLRARRGLIAALLAPSLGAAAFAWGGAGGDPCVPDEERARIETALAANIAQLTADRAISAPHGPQVLLQWPLRQAAGYDDAGYYTFLFFVDHDSNAPNHLLDYNCGTRTKDLLGNHHGTDIGPWPHPWLKMENDVVEVVAAAAGTIVLKQDGFFDKNCECVGASNTIHIRHADGSVAWYMHMKKLSLTGKTVGQTVAAGEYLGRVGSSGCSSLPHLHFELHLANGGLQDPFAGPCNTLNADSWWIEQPPYVDSSISKFTVGFLFPSAPACPGTESTNEWSTFSSVDDVYFTTYFRDPQVGQVATYRLLRPDGTLDRTWDYALPSKDKYVNVETRGFSLSDPQGEWRIEVDYLAQHFELDFTLTGAPGAGAAEVLSVGKAWNGVTLTWSNSCPFQTGRGGIAIGTLGSWYDHTMWWCDYTGGAGIIPWFDMPGSHYFLVVPQNQYTEGSYGQDSQGNERPPGDETCLPQQLGCN